MADLITQTGIPHWLQPPKKDRGTFYPEWVWEHVLSRIRGGETLTAICRDPVMPEYERMLRWVHADEDRKSEYYDARAIGAERTEDEIIEIADAQDSLEDVQRSALRIQARKWLLGVWDRKRYGEQKQVEVTHKVDLSEAIAQANARIEEHRGRTIEGETVSEE